MGKYIDSHRPSQSDASSCPEFRRLWYVFSRNRGLGRIYTKIEIVLYTCLVPRLESRNSRL